MLESSMVSVIDCGAVGDGVADDTVAIQRAILIAQSIGSTREGAVGGVYAPAGYVFRTTASIAIDVPIHVDFRSWINYTPTTGAAIIIGKVKPLLNGLKNTAYDIYFAGFRAVNGNSALPTGINNTGSIAVHVHNLQFSHFRVDEVQCFTKAAIFFDCLCTDYSKQNVQDNTIELGQLGYNGVGVLGRSFDGSNSFGANFVNIQNSFANWCNVDIDYASTSNTFRFAAADAPAGPDNIIIDSVYGKLEVGYLNGSLKMGANSGFNTVNIANNKSTGVAITDLGVNNKVKTGPLNAGYLTAPFTPVINTAYQNTFGVPIDVYGSAVLTPTASAWCVLNVHMGPTNTPPVLYPCGPSAYNPPQAAIWPYRITLRPGQWWKVSSGAGGTIVLNSVTYAECA